MTAPTRDATRETPAAPPRPEPATPRPYQFPRFERRTLPNGLRLVVAPVHKLPVVSVVAVVDAGAVNDPAGREGLSQLTARALTEGTASLDAVALTLRVERLGAALDAGADWDGAIVSLTALRQGVEDAFGVLAEVLVRPTFPERVHAFAKARLGVDNRASLVFVPREQADDGRPSTVDGREVEVGA